METHFQSAKRRRDPDWKHASWFRGELFFGDNPWLAAVRVKSFYVVSLSDHREVAYWTQQPFDEELTHFKMETQILKSGWRERMSSGDDAVPPSSHVRH